jgi:hypothetical protein
MIIDFQSRLKAKKDFQEASKMKVFSDKLDTLFISSFDSLTVEESIAVLAARLKAFAEFSENPEKSKELINKILFK